MSGAAKGEMRAVPHVSDGPRCELGTPRDNVDYNVELVSSIAAHRDGLDATGMLSSNVYSFAFAAF
jgi:hypothetical protein